jgi:hypothetical protein
MPLPPVELLAGRYRRCVRLEGWNHIPEGYGARFNVRSAPRWLRLLFHTPFVDRFAYPLLVRRGHGYLRASPAVPPHQLGSVPPGWRIDPPGYEPPGSWAWLTWRG